MRRHSFIIGSLTALMAFGGLYLLVSYKAPQIIRWYCQRQVDNNIEISVDSCIETHKNIFGLF
jgi:hypothetical protein